MNTDEQLQAPLTELVTLVETEKGLPWAEATRFPIVGIGASAGGLQAFIEFFQNIRSHTGMGFVVVSHLSPNHTSELAQLLQNHTHMQVIQVEDHPTVQPDTVYVIPPGKKLAIENGALQLIEPTPQDLTQTYIDYFLRSLAADQREYAVGVILSGTGADGSAGLKAIKEQAGLTLVQLPEEAEFEGMPRNAVATGLIDFVLPVAELARKLVMLKAITPALPALHDETPPNGEAEILEKIFALVRSKTGQDFTHYKRSTILRRLGRRMQINGIKYLSGYLAFLQAHPVETDALFKDLLISVTMFFRDPQVFDALAQQVLPLLFQRKSDDETVRVWVAGCATGEEAYSLAMMLVDYAGRHHPSMLIQVFATDIDANALRVAREGFYPENIVNDIAPHWLKRFFTREQQGYRVNRELRKQVLFTAHDLLKDPPFSRLDLISCRNVLIYFNREVQDRVFRMFHYALADQGLLFLGNSESVESSKAIFTAVDAKMRFFRRQPTPKPSLWLTSFMPGQRENRTPSAATKTRLPVFEEIHQRLLARQYGPPSVIVNAQYEVVHIAGRAGRYLQFNEGEPTHNVLAMATPALRLELRTALYQAFQMGGEEAFYRAHPVRLGDNGNARTIRLIVQRILETELAGGFVQVIFEEIEATAVPAFSETASSPNEHLVLLEAELQYTKEQLQTLIEQYEHSNQELQASNEELLALNEELQSTTEEMETGREELQSMNEELESSKEELLSTNEELITVNDELQDKIDEVSRANNDLKNLFASTDVALLFLSAELTIKRYTGAVTRLFNIIPSDLGRPLTDVTSKLVYADLITDAQTVLTTAARIRREIRSEDERWYVMQIVPYRTQQEGVDGIVITFVDISELRSTQGDLQEFNQQLEMRIVERTEQVHALSAALTVAEQWERRRISGILHDNLQQVLYGLQMRTCLLKDDMTALAHPDLATQLAEANELLDQAIAATRSLSVELNPPILAGE
ncbi:MAG: PAS domain-containing protein, partial [Chloroflexota bacterium]|nr:PAS domain-containing protein [Chloroflexota bacterium]